MIYFCNSFQNNYWGIAASVTVLANYFISKPKLSYIFNKASTKEIKGFFKDIYLMLFYVFNKLTVNVMRSNNWAVYYIVYSQQLTAFRNSFQNQL